MSKENKEHNVWNGAIGLAQVSEIDLADYFSVGVVCGENVTCHILNNESKDEVRANAELFADALNTIQKCNLMPSQLFDKFYVESTKNDLQAEKIIELQKQRDELIEWAETVINDSYSISRIKELIKKIKQ